MAEYLNSKAQGLLNFSIQPSVKKGYIFFRRTIYENRFQIEKSVKVSTAYKRLKLERSRKLTCETPIDLKLAS